MEQEYIIPVILAVVEGAKQTGLPSKFSFALSVVLGVAFGLISELSVAGGLKGLVYGLSASGLYAGTKSLLKK